MILERFISNLLRLQGRKDPASCAGHFCLLLNCGAWGWKWVESEVSQGHKDKVNYHKANNPEECVTLTRWLNLWEESSNFFALDNISDHMTCDLGVRTVSNDDGRPALESPESCFHLRVSDEDLLKRKSKYCTQIYTYRLQSHLCFHSTNPDSRLCAVGYGMLVPGVKCV